MNRRKRSVQQERRLASRIGGRATPGSGSGWVTKNDVKADDISVEAKFTDKKSYSLKYDDLCKAETQALQDSGREFAFYVGFGKRSGANTYIDREFVVISREYFEDLRSRGNPE